MKEYIVSQEYIDGIYTDEGSTFGLDMQNELIRCKDCTKFVVEEDQAYCLDMFGQCDENGFCAWAERRNDETD